MIKTKTGLTVKCLSSDNEGEYEDSKFKELCVVNRIRMEKTIPRTLQ